MGLTCVFPPPFVYISRGTNIFLLCVPTYTANEGSVLTSHSADSESRLKVDIGIR